MRWLLGLTLAAVLTGACGGDDDDPEEQLRRDLDGVEAAFNDDDAAELYDDYTPQACRESLARDQAVENFESNVDGAKLTIGEPERIEIEEDRATVRAPMTAEAEAEGESVSATDSFEMVFEEGHWRFVDCFGGLSRAD